ncbi:MAG TPA: metallophosphoesterase family protein [Planctomycetota bacterium]|nr:metallophosphoesterase family protein [Planctomycetota bacterium]
MKYGILGDIHSNLEALTVAVRELDSLGVDQYLQVGDVVGYGADPVPCIDYLREIKALCVAGNHDWAVIGKLDASFFNSYARRAVEWTRTQLSREHTHFLESLPLTRLIDEHVTLVHATLDQPEVFEYIQTYSDAYRSLEALETTVCFMGHSHVPMAFLQQTNLVHTNARRLDLSQVHRALINVGSIGQPRDENPQTAFGLFDTNTRVYTLYRETYDLTATREKIARAGLPSLLGERLVHGR